MQRLILATKNHGKAAELLEPLARFGFAVEALPPDYPDIPETGQTFEENALIKAEHVCRHLGVPALADDSGLSVRALHEAPGVYSARYGDDIPALPGESRDARNIRKLLEACRSVPAHERMAAFHCAMALVFPADSQSVSSQPDDKLPTGSSSDGGINRFSDDSQADSRQSSGNLPTGKISDKRYPAVSSSDDGIADACHSTGKQSFDGHPTADHPIIVHEKWEGVLTEEVLGENGFGYDPIFYDCASCCTAAQMSKEEKMSRSHRAKALASLLRALENRKS